MFLLVVLWIFCGYGVMVRTSLKHFNFVIDDVLIFPPLFTIWVMIYLYVHIPNKLVFLLTYLLDLILIKYFSKFRYRSLKECGGIFLCSFLLAIPFLYVVLFWLVDISVSKITSIFNSSNKKKGFFVSGFRQNERARTNQICQRRKSTTKSYDSCHSQWTSEFVTMFVEMQSRS